MTLEEVKYQIALGTLDVKKVVNSRKTPKDVLSYFARSKNKYVRRLVARNTNTRILDLQLLSIDEDVIVIRGVAMNSSTPKVLLYDLANRNIYNIDIGLSRNPKLPFDLMEKYSGKDQYSEIRYNIAKNKGTPIVLLKKIAHTYDPFLSQTIAQSRLMEMGVKND